jgi:hypothetical protein
LIYDYLRKSANWKFWLEEEDVKGIGNSGDSTPQILRAAVHRKRAFKHVLFRRCVGEPVLVE